MKLKFVAAPPATAEEEEASHRALAATAAVTHHEPRSNIGATRTQGRESTHHLVKKSRPRELPNGGAAAMDASPHQPTSVLALAGGNSGQLPDTAKPTAGEASIANEHKTHIKADHRSYFGIFYEMMLYIFYKENPAGDIESRSITQDARYATRCQCIVTVLKQDVALHSVTECKCKTVLQKMKDYFFMPSMFRIVLVEPRRWLRVVLLIFLAVCLLQLWPVLLLFSPLAICVFMLQAYCGICAWDKVDGDGERHDAMHSHMRPANVLPA